MYIENQEQLLDEGFRQRYIEFIESEGNAKRKRNHWRRRELLKDKIAKHVRAALQKHNLKDETIEIMMTRSGNVSILKKVISKLARTYKAGVRREFISGAGDSDNSLMNEKLADLEDLLEFTQGQKKVDKYLELDKNVLGLTLPTRDFQDRSKWRLKRSVLSPWQFDGIFDDGDHEKLRAFVISEFTNKDSSYKPDDDKEYIWWSDSYHFTTDKEGHYINKGEQGEELSVLNPIETMPACFYAVNQDGESWAEGGDDLVEGAVLINVLLTDMFSIAYQQGWGQLIITGHVGNQRVLTGPHHAMILEYDKDTQAEPKVNILNANPPLEMWMKSIEQYVALYLSTNSLSLSTVATKLDAASFPSGIAMIVEMSEATNDIEDKQNMYIDCEKKEFDVIIKWLNYYSQRKLLVSEYQAIGLIPEDTKLSIKFNDAKPVVSEKDKLDNLKARKDLGINEEVDLIMIDNPDLSREDAEEKLLKIVAARLEGFAQAFAEKQKDIDAAFKNEEIDDGDRSNS